jgi:hypothetical protein
MRRYGIEIADEREVLTELESRLPKPRKTAGLPAVATA